MEKEIWKNITGYEGLYQVSNLGNIRVNDRRVFNSKCLCLRKGRILKNNKNGRGYINVSLTKNGKSKNKLVHRLVAEAFIPNPKKYLQVNHKNENKRDNRAENLEWCTSSYNVFYSKHKKCKKVQQIDFNGKVIKTFENALDASNSVNVDVSNIRMCCLNKRKTSAGYIWKYTQQ